MSIIEKAGYCTLCRSRCGTINVVANDTLLEVRPNPSHPTGKAICLKGKSAPELLHSADRILFPMRRTNPKHHPDPGWKRITWEEALSEVANRLQHAKRNEGAESVAFAVTTPSGTPLSDSIDWIERFIRLFGSPNTCYATEICNWHKDHAHAFTFGCGMPTADYRRAELILLWGHNPTNTWLAQAEAIGVGRNAGAKLIVIDPRATPLASQADQWLRVAPGTDLTLAMALANLLIESKAFDLDFVCRWTNGPLLVRADNGHFLRGRDIGWADEDAFVVWDTLTEAPTASRTLHNEDFDHLALRGTFQVQIVEQNSPRLVNCRPAFELYALECAHYSVERTSAITQIPEADIRNAARLIGSASRIAFHAWSGVGQHDNATQTDRAMACLYALTGSFDKIGGNRVYQKPPHNAVASFDLLSDEQRQKALGFADRPLGPPSQGWITARDLYNAILTKQPYAIRTLMAFGTNLLLSQPEVDKGAKALGALDFYVHCDLFESPSARYADILLPVNTPWEREGLRIGFEISAQAEQLVQLRQRMVSSRGESRSDNEIVFDLAVRLGMSDQFFGGSLEAGWDHMLSPSGLSVEILRNHPEGVQVPIVDVARKYATRPRHSAFNTPTGLVELYSERLLNHGYPPLPCSKSPQDGGGTVQGCAFPLVLTSVKSGYFCHSQHRSLASLRRKAIRPELELSSELAAARGIKQGDPVRVTTAVGNALFMARVTEGLHPGVVVGEYGWWQRCDSLGQVDLDATGSSNSNFNSLISSDNIDPISGSSPLRAYRCDVQRDERFNIEQRRWEGFRDFRIAKLVKETCDVTSVYMEPLDGGGLPDFQPGQHATIRLPIGPQEVVRSYSMTGSAFVANRKGYSISVRRATGRTPDGEQVFGRASTYINQELAVGDIISLRAPSGTFIMPVATSRPLVLLAGGIGITPFINLLETLVDVVAPPETLLLYANQQGAAHAFKARLKALQERIPGLEIINFYDRPSAEDQLGVDYDVAGRVSVDCIPSAMLKRRPLFYMCGPAPMMDAFTNALIGVGVPRFDIIKEIFRSPSTVTVEPGQEFRVSFTKSSISRTWKSADGPLLSFAESLGVDLPSGCRVGQCESCSVRVVSGATRHLHGEEPEDSSVCLACQAVPTSDLVLDA
ncbi:Flavohemoprotein [Pseudomonas fluorescens]|uniref:molybdopterin-dependent oxidoreductase n=1 Tax=Pseudomonas fluorescens TaxID=294 RepID=UPI0012430041|nr:molybdopterin-dependent oxidoreductase [Pseudomonas fluorescens]VVQ18619.1 Flavohemoprotein [Pseudomonas fluorescens]